jgi:Bacterial protein of unknown function (DUF937)
MDLVRLIMDQLSPQLIGRIASALGLDSASTQKGIAAAVPALLSGLVALVSKPEGASRLATMLQQEPDQVDRAASMIGGGNQQALVDRGTNTLSSLFGNSTLDSLSGALGRFAGTGEGQAKSLLAMAAPIVMGVLGGQQKSQGLDAKGLANLLTSQKDSIAGAMPAGFANLLSGTGLLEGVSDRVRDAGAGASRAAQSSAAQVQSTARATTAAANRQATATRGSSMRWLWALAALVVLALLAYYWYGSRGVEQVAEPETAPPATQPAPDTATPAVEPAQNLMVGDVDLGERVTAFFDGAKETLQGITDAASAQAALPKLEEMRTNVDQMSDLAAQLPAEGKQALAGLVSSAMPGLLELIDKAMAIPGVSDVLKPVVDPMRAKLESLAQA